MLISVTQYTVTHQDVPNDNDLYKGGSDIEKVEFPSKDKHVPTYSAPFRAGRDTPSRSQWSVTRGPRFFNKLAQPFETVARPQSAHTLTRKISHGSSRGHLLGRSDSMSSNGSVGTREAYSSDSGHARSDSSQQKRWLIE
jgi:hypothetical protein